MLRTVVRATILALLSVPSFADTYQDLLNEALVKGQIAGISAGIAVEESIHWTDGAGYRDIENQTPAGPDMVHRIASITKGMTLVAVMQLVETGAIDLNAPVKTYLPKFLGKPEGTVRVIRLVNHTSGIRHHEGRENRPTEHFNTLLEALELSQDRPLAFPPGTDFLYTTYGYTVLGAVIESAAGQSYVDYMREHVWISAGMQVTGPEMTGVDVPGTSKLYRRYKDGKFVEDAKSDLSVKLPGGGLQSSAGDLLRFALTIQNGTLLPRETFQSMLRSPNASGVYTQPGWTIQTDPANGRYIQMDGWQSGTSTLLRIYLDRRIAVALIANTARASAALQPLSSSLVAMTPQQTMAPAPRPESTPPEDA